MSRRTRTKLKKLVKRILYILSVILLLALLFFIVNRSYMQKQERQEKNREVIEKENMENSGEAYETGVPDSQTDIEKESSSDKEKEKTGEASSDQEQTDREESSSDEEQDNTETSGSANGEITAITPFPSAEQEDAEESSASVKELEDSTLLVLNGTGKAGVAAYWKQQLEEDGYTDVTPASYNLPVEEKTVIYTENPEKAQALLEQFPNAGFSEGKIQNGIEPAEGYPVPEDCEVYIVIGQQDARSE